LEYYFDLLAQFVHHERMQKLRDACSTIALYLDEVTDLSVHSQLLLCATYINKHGVFASEMLELFDVSQKGGTVGANIDLIVTNFLIANDLKSKVDFGSTDGASNVCDAPSQGYMTSYSALFTKRLRSEGQTFFAWWCLCHRSNLALGDLLKSAHLKDFITFLRSLVSHLKSSAQKYQEIGEQVEGMEKLKEVLGESTRQLEREILGKVGNEEILSEEDQVEIDDIKQSLKDKKLDLNQCTAQLKAAGKRRRLRSYLIVRWLSFFNSIESVIAL